jgi:hypothetical protein
VKRRAVEWLKRYLPAECASLVGALLAANVVFSLTANSAAAAIAGAWGENGAYYSVMLLREVRAVRSVWVALRNLTIEFGPAEALDSLLVRPAMMYFGAQLAGDLTLGTLLGKLAADISFYVPAIAAYELRRSLTR